MDAGTVARRSLRGVVVLGAVAACLLAGCVTSGSVAPSGTGQSGFNGNVPIYTR